MQRDKSRRVERLPVQYWNRSIKDLALGETGWTVPWAMYVDPDGYGWIHVGMTVETQPEGTVEMPIKRVGTNEYEVGLPPTYRWHSDRAPRSDTYGMGRVTAMWQLPGGAP